MRYPGLIVLVKEIPLLETLWTIRMNTLQKIIVKTSLWILVSLLSMQGLAESEESGRSAQEQSVIETKINYIVNRVIKEFQVPGVAIAVIENDKITHLKGYGVADIESGQLVNQDTIFKIASNSKAFTSAAIAILVDQGKLNWDDKVTKHLPEFKMYDPWVTNEFNIRDLLTHRSGLRIGAGDLMLWPEPTLFTRQDVIKNLRYLKPVSSFRDQYAYDNLLYIVAGEVVAKISGLSWEEFVQTSIMIPAKMDNCVAGGIELEKHTNLVSPHGVVDGKLKVLTQNKMSSTSSLMAAAGGIKCSVKALSKWVMAQLNSGQLESGDRIYSKMQATQMWKPVTPLPLSKSSVLLDKSTHRSYALGWRISDYFGELQVSHTGTLSGSMSKIVLLPNLNLGLIILTNQQSGYARNALSRSILQEITQLSDAQDEKNWVDFYKEKQDLEAENQAKRPPTEKMNRTEKHIANNDAQNRFLGIYQDPWFGKIEITRVEDKIIFNALKSPRMKGKIYAHAENQWWVKWDDRSHNADAWLFFEILNSEPTTNPFVERNKIILKMKAISETADWSFDFEDLYFKKLKPKKSSQTEN